MPKHVEFGQLADAHSRNAGVDDRMAAIAAKPARWLVEHLSVALLELPGRARADDMLVAIKILNRVERRSEEHTSELQSLMRNSYAVFCLKKKKKDQAKMKYFKQRQVITNVYKHELTK